jgi:hypothetical protein
MALLPSSPQNKQPTEIQNHKEIEDMSVSKSMVNHSTSHLVTPRISYPTTGCTEIPKIITSQALGSTSDDITTARNEGYAQGVTAERERMKAIDNIALPGMEAITNKAKYETGITAEAYAVEVIASQKQKGITFLNNVQADAAELDDVTAAGAPQTDEDEEKELLAYAAEIAQTIRGGKA